MEHKTWLWRRKSTEKTITANEKSDLILAGNDQEKENFLELERSLEDLKEQLSSAQTESNAKANLLAEKVKVAEEALAGWEKAEKEVDSLKQELGHALLQKAAAEARIASIDSALKDCMQQLRVSEEEHQHTIKVSNTKISQEQEKSLALAKRLAQTNDRVATIVVEVGNLRRILEAKEKLIEDVTRSKSELEESLTELVVTLDSSEKDNASLKYEVCMLQKELEIRNQDRDFHLKSADAAHKQYLENIKKISKLESECQRLRVMVRKRLPGPAAIAKMRSEVDILIGNDNDSTNKKVSSLIERLHAVEDENKILKEALVKKNNEIQSSRLMFARTSSKLSQAETQLEEYSRGQMSPLSNDLPLASISEDAGNQDTISCAESWASALISELENFRNGKPTTPSSINGGVSDLSLMDDFIEMEKLAIVCVDKKSESSNITSPIPNKSFSRVNSLNSIGKEIVPVNNLSSGTSKQPYQSDLEKPICIMIELIEGIIQKSFSNNIEQQILDGKDENFENKSFSPSGHAAKIFLWKISELNTVLQQFLVVCNDLLHGKADFKKFTHDVASTLDWIINHCFSLQDVSTMEETVKKLFNGNDLQSDNEFKEAESKLKDENRKMRSEIVNIESRRNDMEERIMSLSSQLKESRERIFDLEAELATVKNSKRLIEDQIESQKLIMEDLITQLTVANAELNEARKKFSSLEGELEDKSNCCEELETTCMELQLQLESVVTKEAPKYDDGQEEKQLRTDWEISAASEKLAECQATILDLGKQLKALAAPKDAPLFDKVISPRINHRPQLIDHMQADDESRSEHLKSPKTKEIICTEVKAINPNAGLLYGKKLPADIDIAANHSMDNIDQPSPVKSSRSFNYKLNEFPKKEGETGVGKLVIVPNNQKGSVSFLRRLLSRKRKGSNKKQALPVGS